MYPPRDQSPAADSISIPSNDLEKLKAEDSLFDNELEDLPQITLRSMLVGCLLGTVISASNFYMGLKLGWTFGASIFGAIFGFSILLAVQKLTHGRRFGPKEHCALQTAATAAGSGTTAGYISGIPAMYRMGLLTSIQGDLTRIALWALAASLYGIFFAIPLRKYFILKQKLVFPTPTGAANIIKSFHASDEGASQAGKKTKALLIILTISIVWLLLAFFVPVLKNWHIFYWIGHATHSKFFLEADAWNFYFTLSFAFLGAGLMTTFNNAASTMAGSILGWDIIGPILLAKGIAFDPRFSFGKDVAVKPSPRYFLLWLGIAVMICGAFTELFCNYKMLWRGVKGGAQTTYKSVRRLLSKSRQAPHHQTSLLALKTTDVNTDMKEDDDDDEIHDPAPYYEQVPALWWVLGLFASIILTVVVLYFAWGIGVGETLLAVFLGFIFAFIGIQSSGETDINPTGAIAKSSQIVLAALPPQNATGTELQTKQTTSLAAGLLAAAAAHQSTDMVGDLKTGHLLRASPRAQFYAQIIGSFFSIISGLAFWVLFASAYPCITNDQFDNTPGCPFPLIAVTGWQGVTMALTTKNAIPLPALYTAFGLGAVVVIYTIIKNKVVPASWKPYMPNMNAIGVALVNTDQSLIISLFAGACFGVLWKRKSPSTYDMYMFAIAAGLVAGEGIFGVVQALFAICGLHEGMGTTWGMPPGR